MSIPVSEIVLKASTVLNDKRNVRWTVPELIGWINDAGLAIQVRRAAATSKIVTVTFVAGVLQAIPDDGAQLLDLVRNLGADGATPGRAISIVDRRLLDDETPDWYSAKQADTIQHYTHDARAPKAFYVYPPAKAGLKAEMLYSAFPTPIALRATTADILTTDVLEVSKEYIDPAINYVCYRAMSKDNEFAQAQLASAYYAAFTDSLSMQKTETQSSSPESASV